MSCAPQVTFLKFDPRTGRASAAIPLTAKPMKIVCTMTKRALNGKHETKMLTIMTLALPPSVCTISGAAVPKEMKSNSTGSQSVVLTKKSMELLHEGQDCWVGCASKQGDCNWCGGGGTCCRIGWHDKTRGCDGKLGTPGKGHTCVRNPKRELPVKDLRSQCPGDKFELSCANRAHLAYVSFNQATGVATAKFPSSATDIAVDCKLYKRAQDGNSEIKYFKFKVLATPASKCMIDTATIPKEMKSMATGTASIIKTVSVPIVSQGKECANENGTCNCNGFVRYGDWNSQRFSKSKVSIKSLPCNNATFGDVAVGITKRCWCMPAVKSVVVTDVAKQCPGDKFDFKCYPTNNFVTFDAKTGKASAKTPRTSRNISVSCKVYKTALNKQQESKELRFTVLALPASVCAINPKMVSMSMKPGTSGSMSAVISTKKTSTTVKTTYSKGYFKKITLKTRMPYGYRQATVAEATKYLSTVKRILGKWDIIALAGGYKIDGYGYGSKISKCTNCGGW